MAYKIIATHKRPNTGVDFPRMSDHNSDYDTWRRQYFTDNGISISFELSGDELTLTSTCECADRATWNAWLTADETDGRYDASVKASVNSDYASRSITIKIDADEDGTVTNLVPEGNSIP